MDPRHPNIAFAANTGALIAFIGLLFSAFLPFGTPRGWSTPETVLIVIIPLFAVLAYWAKREHEIPIVHQHSTSSAQYEAMEDLPTMVSLDKSESTVNSNTAAVIESIIGSQVHQDTNTISNAIGTLSTGEIGKSSAAVVNANTNKNTETLALSKNEQSFQTEGVPYIPLPNIGTKKSSDLPPMLDLPDMIDLEDIDDVDEETNNSNLDLPELPDF